MSQFAAEERRSSWRGPVLVPITVRWEQPGGKAMKAEAQAKEVNIHCGLLQFFDPEEYPIVGAEMKLTNLLSGEKALARASAIRRSKDGAVLGVAVEFPSNIVVRIPNIGYFHARNSCRSCVVNTCRPVSGNLKIYAQLVTAGTLASDLWFTPGTTFSSEIGRLDKCDWEEPFISHF